jgi:hypothetical protein
MGVGRYEEVVIVVGETEEAMGARAPPTRILFPEGGSG